MSALADPPPPSARKGTSLWADAWRRWRRNRLAVLGAVIVVLTATMCFLLPPLLGLDPEVQDTRRIHEPPSGEHWFGTDNLGRDYAARVLVGGRISLLVGLVATAVSVLIGALYGAIAGYYGGRLDEVLMRFVDFLYGIPYMFLVILIMLMFEDTARGSALPVFLALGLVQWLPMARIVRGQVLTLRDREFVQAARVIGTKDMAIVFRHILPNVMSYVVIYASLTVPAVIILESFLSFLGLGVELSWGKLVAGGVGVVNPVEPYWWLLVFPAAFLALTLFSLNFVGDGLRDALDPRTRR